MRADEDQPLELINNTSKSGGLLALILRHVKKLLCIRKNGLVPEKKNTALKRKEVQKWQIKHNSQ